MSIQSRFRFRRLWKRSERRHSNYSNTSSNRRRTARLKCSLTRNNNHYRPPKRQRRARAAQLKSEGLALYPMKTRKADLVIQLMRPVKSTRSPPSPQSSTTMAAPSMQRRPANECLQRSRSLVPRSSAKCMIRCESSSSIEKASKASRRWRRR